MAKDDQKDMKAASKWFWFIPLIFFGIYIFLVVVKTGPYPKDAHRASKDGHDQTTTGQPPPGLTAEQQLRKELPKPEVGLMDVNNVQEAYIDVPAGMSVRLKLTGPAVGFEYYIDHQIVYQCDATGKRTGHIAATSGAHTEGMRLKPGQQISQMKAAYVLFMGPEPSESTWYALALASDN